METVKFLGKVEGRAELLCCIPSSEEVPHLSQSRDKEILLRCSL
jgi:hypothetical protein